MSGVTLGRRLPDGPARSVPYLRVANVKDGYLALDDIREIQVTGVEFERWQLREGDLLLTEGGDPDKLGRGAVWKRQLPDCIHQNHIFRVRLDPGVVLPEFASAEIASPYGKSYFLRHAKQTIGIATINQKVLADFPLKVPPVTEQRRILAILDEQMTMVDRVRAAAEARLAGARGLPSAYLRSMFDGAGGNEWRKASLGDVLTLRKDVIHPRDLPRGRARFVGLEHIESGTGLRTGSVEVELADLTGRKPKFEQGEIVYGYLRPYLNKVWVAEFNGLCSVDQYVFRVDPAHDPHFIAAFMRSASFLRRAPIATTPGQLPRIRTDEVASVSIALPPLLEQRRLLSQLAAADEATAKVRRSSEGELTAIKNLAIALLRRAFTGEL